MIAANFIIETLVHNETAHHQALHTSSGEFRT